MIRKFGYMWALNWDNETGLVRFNPQPRAPKYIEPIATDYNGQGLKYSKAADQIEVIWTVLTKPRWTLITSLDLVANLSRKGTARLPDRAGAWHNYNVIWELSNYNREIFYKDVRLLFTIVKKLSD